MSEFLQKSSAMARFLFPAIDLRAGRVVRLTQGKYDEQTTYGDDPLAQARVFERAGAAWLHVVDLEGARSGELTHLPVIRSICESTKLKVEVGGGVRSQQVVDALLGAGVERVVVGTAALRDWAWFEKLVHEERYRGKIVLGLDAKDGKATSDGWETTSDTAAIDIAKRVAGWPLAAIVYTDIAVDGMLTGPNVEATRAMSLATDVPVVASGGVGTLDHLRSLKPLALQGTIIGKSLYENRFTIDEALAVYEGDA